MSIQPPLSPSYYKEKEGEEIMNQISIPLWKNKGKNSGKSFLVGKIKLLGLSVMVFENTRKEKPNQPDFNLVISRDTYNDDKQVNTSNNFFDGTMNHQDDNEIPF